MSEDSVAIRWALLIGLLACPLASPPVLADQQLAQQRLAALRDELVLICESHDNPGGNHSTASEAAARDAAEVKRHIMVELVARVDLQHDGHLDHRDLSALDPSTRQELLWQLDDNLDRQLSPSELESLRHPVVPPNEYPYVRVPKPTEPPRRESFQNLRRFGVGDQRTVLVTRPQPFAQAAVFGNTPNFAPPTQKSELDRRGDFLRTRPTATVFAVGGRCE